MTQRDRVLMAVGDRAVTSLDVSALTGLSIAHCSNYLCDLERRGKLRSLGEKFDRSKVWVKKGNRKHSKIKRQLIKKEDREWLRKAEMALLKVKRHLNQPGAWQSRQGA